MNNLVLGDLYDTKHQVVVDTTCDVISIWKQIQFLEELP